MTARTTLPNSTTARTVSFLAARQLADRHLRRGERPCQES